jgi:hypothetical protein
MTLEIGVGHSRDECRVTSTDEQSVIKSILKGVTVMQIHLVGGEKGGVGKTFVSRCLVQYFLLQNWDFDLIEADVAIADVSSVFKDASTITLSDNPHRYAEPDIIFEKAQKKTVIVNLPSNTQGVLNQWIQQTNLLGMAKEYEISVVYWFVTDGCFSSIRLLERSLAEFDYAIPHLLIRNRGRLNGIDFSYLEREPIYKKAMQAKNLLKVLDFPILGSAEQFFVDRHELMLQDAQGLAADEIGVIPAQRIKTFMDQMVKVFESVDLKLTKSLASTRKPIKIKGVTGDANLGDAATTTPQES